MKKEKTLLIGNFGAGNIGDELILLSALEQTSHPVVMTSDPTWSQAFTGEKFTAIPMPPTGFRSWLRYLLFPTYEKQLKFLRGTIHAVVFPGGGLFAIRDRAVWIWTRIFFWARKLYPERILLLHQGVDENMSRGAQKRMKKVFFHADQISVRDEVSVRAVKALSAQNVENVGDRVTKWLSTHYPQKKGGFPQPKTKRLLINARKKFDFPALQKEYPDYQYIFVAFDPSDLRAVPADFPGEVIHPTHWQEVVQLFQDAREVVGERLHFLLLGEWFCSARYTRLLQEPYSQKVSSFAAEKNLKISSH